MAQIDESNASMTWGTLSLTKKIDNRFSVGYSQLHSFDERMELRFIQSNFKVTYRLNKQWRFITGYKPTVLVNSKKQQKIYHRIFGEIQHNSRFGNWRIRNAVTAEHNFTQRPKFKQRYYYTLKVTYSNKKLPLRMQPYLMNRLYYYAGGSPRIYDVEAGLLPEGSPEVEEALAPNGFHAYRIQAGVSMKLAKRVRLNVYHMRQFEFDDILGGRPLVVENEVTGKITGKYFNTSVIGVSLGFTF